MIIISFAEGSRICTHCRLPKPSGEFYRNPRTLAWASWCKLCGRTDKREAYKKIGRPVGERNGKCKIPDEQRATIASSNLSPTRLARVFGVNRSTIQRIRRLARRSLSTSTKER